MLSAIGNSLVSVAAVRATTAASYALSGLIDPLITILFIAGGLMGGVLDVKFGAFLSRRKSALRLVFGVSVILVGLCQRMESLMRNLPDRSSLRYPAAKALSLSGFARRCISIYTHTDV